jgi:hypothetical protein
MNSSCSTKNPGLATQHFVIDFEIERIYAEIHDFEKTASEDVFENKVTGGWQSPNCFSSFRSFVPLRCSASTNPNTKP